MGLLSETRLHSSKYTKYKITKLTTKSVPKSNQEEEKEGFLLIQTAEAAALRPR